MSGNFYEGLLAGHHTSQVGPTATERYISAPLTTDRLRHHDRRRNATKEPIATRDIRGWGGGVGKVSKKRSQSAAKLGAEPKDRDAKVSRRRQHQAYEPKRSIKASVTMTSGRLTTSRQRRKTSSALVSKDGDSPGGFPPIGARSAKSGSTGDQCLSVPPTSSVRTTTPLLQSRHKRQQAVAGEPSDFDKDVQIAERKLADFEPEIPRRKKPGHTDCDDARRAIMQLYHERQRQVRKVDSIPKSPRKLERTHINDPDWRAPEPPGSAFGRIEFGEATTQRATTPTKQSRPQRFADLTKLHSATANYDMWASAAEPSNAEDSTWTFEELLG